MKASVIMSDVNEQGMLLASVFSVCNQSFDANEYEVILPDYGLFTKKNAAVITRFEEEYAHFRVLRMNIKNRSELINEAVKNSRGELLLFLESHCIAGNDWVKGYVEFFKNKRVEIARGEVRTIPTDDWLGQSEEIMRQRVMNKTIDRGVIQKFFDFHNSAIRKNCFTSAGGLSEKIPILAEFELGARMYQGGSKIQYCAQVSVWHANATDFRNYARVVGQQGREKVRILNMHGESFLKEYFPSDKPLQLIPVLKVFRIPFLMLTKLMVFGGIIGFYVGLVFKLHSVSNFYFRIFAKGTFWHGMLSGLKEYKAI